MNNKYVVVSDRCIEVCDKLKNMSYKLIHTECVDGFISYEKKHADMQCIALDNNVVFVLSQCKSLANTLENLGFDVRLTSKKASGKYPDNIILNAKVVGKHLIGKIASLDKNLVEYCINNGYELIDVNQGYSACSCLKVNENAIITADNSIYKALIKTDIDVLKISSGNIRLIDSKREEEGFIGGASVNLGDSILFFGDIRKHPD